MGISLDWTLTLIDQGDGYVILQYQARWSAAGGLSGGSCGLGVPGFTFGAPWGGVADLDMPDFLSNPDVAGWYAMLVHVGTFGYASIGWSCPCGGSCTFSGETVTTSWRGSSGAVLLDDYGHECTSSPTPGASFTLGAGPSLDGAANEFFTPSNPPPSGTYVEIAHDGNAIELWLTLSVTVWPQPAPPPPPVLPPPTITWPPNWSPPAAPIAPPCGQKWF